MPITNKYNKVRKGLACCSLRDNDGILTCKHLNCPYLDIGDGCKELLAYDAHEIICRQEKTIAKLKMKNKKASETIDKLKKAEEKRKEEEAITNSYKDAVFSGGF